MQGDVAIQYQVQRDLCSVDKPRLRTRIGREGWGAAFLARRHANGHWGRGFYQPKWTSTHYTLLDLKNLSLPPDNRAVEATLDQVARDHRSEDGGIYPIGPNRASDVCVNGMFLNYASHFGQAEEILAPVVDFLISERMDDGAFNCDSNGKGARHSSVDSTLSVLEGIREYLTNGYRHRAAELASIEQEAGEFLLAHRLFKSHRTGAVMDPRMQMLSYPSRWRYDVLRALDYFRLADSPWDARMQDAIDVVVRKRRADGTWPVQAKHPGATHFDMEQTGKPSRWNTLRAMRVLAHFDAGP